MVHEFRYTLQNMLQCCLLLRWWWLWCCQSIKWFKGVMMLSGDYFWLPLFMVQMASCTHMRFWCLYNIKPFVLLKFMFNSKIYHRIFLWLFHYRLRVSFCDVFFKKLYILFFIICNCNSNTIYNSRLKNDDQHCNVFYYI